MKNAIYFLGFSFNLISLNLSAQNYNLFNSGQDQFFKVGTSNILFQNFNSINWSDIKQTDFDSIVGNGNDTIFYPFHTWIDTTYSSMIMDPDTGYMNGPSWMGSSIHELNGITYLFNSENDSIKIIQSAVFGQTWNMMNFDSYFHVNATVDSVFILTLAGITDSVKQITLSLDSNGVVLNNHDLNERFIWISKSNGIFKGVSFRDLPKYSELNRIAPIPKITYGDLYNYDVGDEFEFQYQCHGISMYGPPAYTLHKITGKWYSVAMDTVFYLRNNFGMTFQTNSSPPPLYISVFTQDTDTVFYTNLNQQIYSEAIEENTIQKFNLSNDSGVYTLGIFPNLYNGRLVYSEVSGFYYLQPPYMLFYDFEPTFYGADLSPGLGVTHTYSDYISQSGQRCDMQLIYYKKGTETWGNYISAIAGVDELKNADAFQVYPNPASDQCQIFTDPKSFNKIEIFSFNGQKISELKINEHITSIELEDYSSGLYIFKASGIEGVIIRRFIKL